jgi:hypothetical protein
MNTDTLASLAGAGTATALLSQIDFTKPGWWKQALVAFGVLALGFLTNKVKSAPVTLAKAGKPEFKTPAAASAPEKA